MANTGFQTVYNNIGLEPEGRNPHERTSWKLVGNPGHELVTN